MEVIIIMTLQDIIAYTLAGAMVIGFVYLAWASRQEKYKDKGSKGK
jgi:hypothetical protein